MTFTPEFKFSSLPSWDGKNYDNFIEATGVIDVTYNQSQKVVFNGKKCQINLGNHIISNKKTAITGGYSGKGETYEGRVAEQAANYIQNNLDKFKQLAIQQIPEAVNATNIVVVTPNTGKIY